MTLLVAVMLVVFVSCRGMQVSTQTHTTNKQTNKQTTYAHRTGEMPNHCAHRCVILGVCRCVHVLKGGVVRLRQVEREINTFLLLPYCISPCSCCERAPESKQEHQCASKHKVCVCCRVCGASSSSSSPRDYVHTRMRAGKPNTASTTTTLHVQRAAHIHIIIMGCEGKRTRVAHTIRRSTDSTRYHTHFEAQTHSHTQKYTDYSRMCRCCRIRYLRLLLLRARR